MLNILEKRCKVSLVRNMKRDTTEPSILSENREKYGISTNKRRV